jgi:hypothetical protein
MEPFSQHPLSLSETQFLGTRMLLCLDCRWQVRLFHAIVKPWTKLLVEMSNRDADDSFVEDRSEFETIIWASRNWSSETTVQLVLGTDGPTTSEVRWMLAQFDDFQFGVKTLQPYSQFSGNEMDPASLKETTHRPAERILAQSKESLLRLVQDLRLETEMAMKVAARFDI